MYVCMSVRNRFTIEIYGFMHSLRTFWHVPLRMPLSDDMEIKVEDSEDKKTTPDRVQMYGRQLTAQQKDERQDNSDTKRLARHHPSFAR